MEINEQNVATLRRTIEQRIRDTPVDARQQKDFYVFSYPHWVAEFAHITENRAWTTNTVILAMSAMYAWMPKTVKSYIPSNLAKLPSLLNEGAPVSDIIPVAACCLSNSLVAGSKFTHCYKPEQAPILDATLESWLWPDTPSKLATSGIRLTRYSEWMAAIAAVAAKLKQKARQWARNAFGYDVSDVRAIEALCFYTAR
ncbi:hypothetical protein [Paraburkholderia sp. RL17-381-BIF-C]|jgi:hypothetical protein|uniref:hypothetical protein n=1 Tax=Paraburkholderia sp. RL17-381-BIF-C TaxID=3031635 RepID=UPI0038B98DCE